MYANVSSVCFTDSLGEMSVLKQLEVAFEDNVYFLNSFKYMFQMAKMNYIRNWR